MTTFKRHVLGMGKRGVTRVGRIVSGIVLCWLLAFPAQGTPSSWTLGVFPIVTPVTLFQRFSPLAQHLAERLHHPVVLETARDFPTFVQRTSEARYEFLVTAPHFALRAEDEGHYRIVASLKRSLRGFYVVHRDSPLRNLEDLAGKVVATPPPQAIITAAGKLDLREVAGLDGERAPRFRAFRSHNAAYQAVLGGQVDAAVVSVNAVRRSLDQGAPLRILGKTRPLPNTAFLVRHDLEPKVAARVTAILTAMDSDPQGKRVLAKLGFPGYRPASLADYEILRPYLSLLELR